ncbi:hypothetical protein M405DRAFT_12129 [Rhizopogon salebrosus TDB-379]|nr:hypothetical protein M405DRAFT_12129 [Rhizopogon salebrosus TDB-379]
MFSACSGVRKRHEYYKSHGGIAIVVKLRGQQSVDSSEEILDLYPTTDDIFSICPRRVICTVELLLMLTPYLCQGSGFW